MRTPFLALVALFFFTANLFAQNGATNPWEFISEKSLSAKSQQRRIVPQAQQTLRLDVSQLQAILAAAPLWQTPAARAKTVVLTLPMPDGTFQDFRIEEAPVMHPDLAAKYPMIKSYAGVGLDDPTAYLRCDLTPQGFHGMVRTARTSTVYIDPYSTADIEHYISYYRKDFSKNATFECGFDDVNEAPKGKASNPVRMAGDCQLRTYVLALACTGEYAQYHGGTTAEALAAMNTTMTRVNGVFEIDANVHMDLHPNTDTLIFLDPATDPYTNSNGSTMLGQNQTTCDARIGNANYDIGHVFSTGGGGVAYLGALCNTSNKAGGVTGQTAPIGDPFDIDYVAHEMGHQYGANHTQNNSCNRNSSTAMEPGSASTIMGYAGICTPNVQNNSDDFFHAISLQEMAAELTSNGGGGGNTCSTNTDINDAPTADAGANYTIPISTPFVLTGIGTDPDDDPITYTWEQMNNTVATMPPVSTNTGGPAFRSFKGTASPNRYLPRLQDLVNNTSPTWEVLASVSRTYNWRLTVRDNHMGGGCTAEDNMVVTVSNSSGPFVVTAPNTGVSWPALSSQTITWNVANTTAAPVSAANVDIFLSTDGGFTYPVTLATGVTNDGSQVVTIPDNQTSTARVMVRGAGNIFFDISNQNFTIAPPENDFTFDVTPNALAVCSPSNGVFNVDIGVTGTFTGNVTLATSGVPAGATATFSTNPVSAPGSSQLTIGNTSGVTPGTYNITVSGTGSTGTKSEVVTLTISNGLPATASLQTPANGATGVSLSPTLDWANVTGAASYTLQLATDAGFTDLIVNEAGLMDSEYAVTDPLDINTTYHWRAKAVNACGDGAYSAAFSFTTLNVVCSTFVSTDVPKTIPSSGTPTVTSTLDIPVAGSIIDVNVLDLDIDHTYINDLIVRLKSPANTERTLLNRICGSQNNILLSLDDESSNPYSSIPCPPNGGTYQPFQALSAFDDEDPDGTWTLTVQDVFNQDGGAIVGWSIEVCYVPDCTPPSVSAPTVIQPTCPSPTGIIVVNASGGGALEYSVDNGNSWQAVTTFSGLAPGSYNVLARLQSDPNCSTEYASNPVVLIAAPAPVTYYADSDGDGFGNPAVSQTACTQPSGYVTNNTDCDDTDANEHPGQTWYLDADGDGYSPGTSLVQCLRPANYFLSTELTATSGDCDDSNAAIHPNATEVCNGIDDDCDTMTDEGVTTTYFADVDADGFGDPAVSQQACTPPTGYVLDNTDNCLVTYNPDQDDADNNGVGDICQDCPVSLVIFPYAPNQTTFEAQQDILTSGTVTVQNGMVRIYQAGSGIMLDANFEVELGGELDVLNQACTPLQGGGGKEE